jgi:glucosamine-phosphate N-acetyltransferase
MDYSSLECFKRHGISYNHPGDGLRMRPLEREDYEKGYITLLSQLTKVGDVSRLKFEQRFDEMKNNPGSYYIIVVEDIAESKIVCSATLLIERKFIHGASLRGRIEDVVVDEGYRSKHLGRLVLETQTELSKLLGCYKITLDCKPALVGFYEKFGYSQENCIFLVQRFFD